MPVCSKCGCSDVGMFAPSRQALASSWCRPCSTKRKAETYDKEKGAAAQARRRDADPAHALVLKARSRAKKGGYPCTITAADVPIPATCPILGIQLAHGDGKPTDSSPSLDKVDPALGYIPGNVRVISFRANAKKSDFTIPQLERLLLYMRGELP
jgi:hypothetical protein